MGQVTLGALFLSELTIKLCHLEGPRSRGVLKGTRRAPPALNITLKWTIIWHSLTTIAEKVSSDVSAVWGSSQAFSLIHFIVYDD